MAIIFCGGNTKEKEKIANRLRCKLIKDELTSCLYRQKTFYFDGREKIEASQLPKVEYAILLEQNWGLQAKNNFKNLSTYGMETLTVVEERGEVLDIEAVLKSNKENYEKTNVFLLGKSNAGKSTIFNFFAKTTLAKVAASFVTTKHVLHQDCGNFMLIDSVGYLSSIKDTEEWRTTKNFALKANLCAFVVSIDQLNDKINDVIMGLLHRRSVSFFIILNKIDLCVLPLRIVIQNLRLRWRITKNIDIIPYKHGDDTSLIAKGIKNFQKNRKERFNSLLKKVILPSWCARIKHVADFFFKVYCFKGLVVLKELKTLKRQIIEILSLRNAQPRLILRTVHK